jgi:hypothetical protein
MGDRWDGDTGGISRRPRSRWDGDVSRTPPASPGGGGRLLVQHPLLTDTIQHTASTAPTAPTAPTTSPTSTAYSETKEPPDTPQTSIPFYNTKPPVTG